jgi:hypothetical protein
MGRLVFFSLKKYEKPHNAVPPIRALKPPSTIPAKLHGTIHKGN